MEILSLTACMFETFPGSYSWVSGNLLASGWSPTPPDSPPSQCQRLSRQLPGKVKQRQNIDRGKQDRTITSLKRVELDKRKVRKRSNVHK